MKIKTMLSGENINLRPLQLADWKKTLNWRNDTEIKAKAMMHPYPITEFIEKKWYQELLKSKSNKEIYFAITEKNDNPIGYIFLHKISSLHNNCYLGIVVGDSAQRSKGNGSEAIKILLQYAFSTLNIKKISVEVIKQNRQAIYVYKKLGFVQEGCLKEQFFSNGTYNDVLIMSLFKIK